MRPARYFSIIQLSNSRAQICKSNIAALIDHLKNMVSSVVQNITSLFSLIYYKKKSKIVSTRRWTKR